MILGNHEQATLDREAERERERKPTRDQVTKWLDGFVSQLDREILLARGEERISVGTPTATVILRRMRYVLEELQR